MYSNNCFNLSSGTHCKIGLSRDIFEVGAPINAPLTYEKYFNEKSHRLRKTFLPIISPIYCQIKGMSTANSGADSTIILKLK